MESGFVSYFDREIAVYQAGKGTSILFLHGNSGSSRIWQKQFSGELAQKFNLVAMDLPGCGKSGRAKGPVNDYTLQGHARYVSAVMDELKLVHPVVVGHSLGGHVAMELAALRKDLGGIMIFGSPPVKLPLNLDEAFIASAFLQHAMTENLNIEQAMEMGRLAFLNEIPDEFISDVLNTDPDFRKYLALSISESRGFSDESKILENLEIPIAILHGKQDIVANYDYMTSLTIPSLWEDKVIVKDPCGHFPQWDEAAWFNSRLEQFISHIQINKKIRKAG